MEFLSGLEENGLHPNDPSAGADDMVAILILAALAAGGGAVAIESKSAWAAILVEVAGLLLGVVLALKLGERLIRRARRGQWLRVSDQMAELTRTHVIRLGLEYQRALVDAQIPIRRGWQPLAALADPTAHTLDEVHSDLTLLVSRVQASADDLGRAVDEPGRATDFATSSSSRLLQAVEPHLRPLRETMTTRVILVADDPDLVRPLLELERASDAWRSFVSDVLRFGTADAQGWDSAAAALGAAASVFAAFGSADITAAHAHPGP